GRYTDIGTQPGKDRSYRIWTAKCTPGEKFTVVRTLQFLGPPSDLTLRVAYGGNPASTEVLVNGRKLASWRRNVAPPAIGRAQLQLFHEGQNEIEFVVKIESSAGACSGPTGHKGVWFNLSGEYATDLGVGSSDKKVQYFKADKGRSVVVRIHLINAGPDLIPEGTF